MSRLVQLVIPKKSLVCFSHHEKLQPGMEIYSILHEDEAANVIRQDYCSACWQMAQPALDKALGYWKSKIELKKEKNPSSQTQRALQLLKDKMCTSEKEAEEIFILSIFLAHKRALVLRKEFQKEGQDFQLYEAPKQEEFFTIQAFQLSELNVIELQKSLAQQLN